MLDPLMFTRSKLLHVLGIDTELVETLVMQFIASKLPRMKLVVLEEQFDVNQLAGNESRP